MDVIVVGAGPAGSSAAYHLARQGHRVLLLDRHRFPRDKSCGDGLTLSCLRLLAEMGVLEHLQHAQRNYGVRVFMQGKGSRDFRYPHATFGPDYGLVVPRYLLDNIICRQAVAAGAILQEKTLVTGLTYDNGAVTGVQALRDEETIQLRAPVVVAADGAASRLAMQAGLSSTRADEGLGFAIRGYYTDIDGLDELLEIYMPLLDPTDRYLLPSYGWVFPTGPRSANIGVGLFERRHGVNIRSLFHQFLSNLCRQHPRFINARLEGRWLGAPLRFDFTPERCVAPGLILVGDAAGLVSPFTGEGISYALESGKLAAEAIHRNLRNGATPDLTDYAILLEKTYTGYFETGRKSARRYLLAWHVLESTFDNERPLFQLCRRAVLMPEAVGEPYASKVLDDISPLVSSSGLNVREDLLAVGEILTNAIRHDWPFLARLSTVGQGDPGIPFRPSLLLLLCGYWGNNREPLLIRMGAAVELGYVAALAHLSVEEPTDATQNDGSQPANWGNMLALMVGDLLLSKAHQLSASAGAAVSQIMAEALARVCEGRLRELRTAFCLSQTEEEHLAIVALKSATLFELPCQVGAILSGAPPAIANALSEYGQYLGMSFQLADDALALDGKESKLGQATRSELSSGVYSLAVLKALRHLTIGEHLRSLLSQPALSKADLQRAIDLVRDAGGITAALDVAHEYAAKAQATLALLTDSPSARTLGRLAEYAVTREVSSYSGLNLN